MPLQIFCQNCGPLATNAYLLHETEENILVIVDPAIDADELLERARQLVAEGARFAAIWNTHGHFDHVYDNALWKAEFNVPVFTHPADAFFLEHLREQALWFGLPAPEVVPADNELHEGDTLQIGKESARVWELPGHSPGSVAFDFGTAWIVGDVLFQGSVGRTDLPSGDALTLARSIERLWQLPDETLVLPGHGGSTTIGSEKQSNEVARQLLEVIR
ncbi:MBL fold metallo-hydrolase [bacterium]|nr:MAG: MBL fold metallo-hydrolase [bacterium]